MVQRGARSPLLREYSWVPHDGDPRLGIDLYAVVAGRAVLVEASTAMASTDEVKTQLRSVLLSLVITPAGRPGVDD